MTNINITDEFALLWAKNQIIKETNSFFEEKKIKDNNSIKEEIILEISKKYQSQKDALQILINNGDEQAIIDFNNLLILQEQEIQFLLSQIQ